MQFNAADILLLKRFLQEIIGRPRPMEVQPSVREGIYLWCEDWEIIEILKYLFHGKEVYYGDPPPNRLKNNPLWSKEEIEKKAEQLKEKYQNAARIIEALSSQRNAAASRVG